MIIEVVVYTIDAALQAEIGMANRIELCDNPLEGGTTPSYGTIEQIERSMSQLSSCRKKYHRG